MEHRYEQINETDFVCAGMVRGGGFQKIGACMNLGAYYLVGAPIAFLLGFGLKLNAKGLWMGTLTGSILSAIILAVVTVLIDWQKEVGFFYFLIMWIPHCSLLFLSFFVFFFVSIAW